MKVYLQDYVRRENCEYEIAGPLTLGNLLRELDCEQHMVLVNGSFQSHDYRLQDGDVVSIIPIPTGG